MKPPKFQYCAPHLLEEALELLQQYGEDGKVLAGGQSLIPLLNMRLTHPLALIDINRLTELEYMEQEDGYLAIGAVIRQRQVERSEIVRQRYPLLLEVVQHIGHMQIRNRGTIVGSISHADPAAELPALLTCLNGEVVVQCVDGERVIKAEEFFTGYLETTLLPGELVTEVRFPWLSPQAGWAFMECARRSGDYALAGIVAVLEPAPDGSCRSAHVAYLGIAGQPVRAYEVEKVLLGTQCDEQSVEGAAEIARSYVGEDVHDMHATGEYRRVLTAELTRRALRRAWDMCHYQKEF